MKRLFALLKRLIKFPLRWTRYFAKPWEHFFSAVKQHYKQANSKDQGNAMVFSKRT